MALVSSSELTDNGDDSFSVINLMFHLTCNFFNFPALRIHMSYSTAEILLRDGGFDLKCRGTILVKVRVNIIRYAQIID